MDRLHTKSRDIIQDNIGKLAELFPSAVTEAAGPDGGTRLAVNFERLKEILSGETAAGPEFYEFTWTGKRAAFREAARVVSGTLRPMPEEGRDWENTGNAYIEGDNLDVLKLLLNSYSGRIKMIYIDPPYNTGNDFIYRDRFARPLEEHEKAAGIIDPDGGRLFRNTAVNGRFHSDWCSMIYSRLMVAARLLTDDGVIFISIDDNEDVNTGKICDEIFGAANFIAKFIWERAYSPKNDAKYVSMSHDYVIMYSRNKTKFKIGRLPRTEEANARYSNPDNDPRGPWKSSDLSVKRYTPGYDYPIKTPSGRTVHPPTGRCWGMLEDVFMNLVNDNRIWFGENGDSVPSLKRFISELRHDGMAPTSMLFYKDVGHSQEGSKEVVSLFEGKGHFDGPKPTRLLKRLITLANAKDDDIILDFFSGSATTAHAVMQLNAEDGGSRRFIMVQLPEECPEKSEAAKAGFRNICEIGRERIRRAGDRILADLAAGAKAGPEGLLPQAGDGAASAPTPRVDTGFRAFRVDASPLAEVNRAAEAYSQGMLPGLTPSIRDGRTDLDLLFECALAWGLPLDFRHEVEEMEGVTVHSCFTDGAHPDLMACFSGDVPDGALMRMARARPLGAVFRDAGITSEGRLNMEIIFGRISPDTAIRIL